MLLVCKQKKLTYFRCFRLAKLLTSLLSNYCEKIEHNPKGTRIAALDVIDTENCIKPINTDYIVPLLRCFSKAEAIACSKALF